MILLVQFHVNCFKSFLCDEEKCRHNVHLKENRDEIFFFYCDIRVLGNRKENNNHTDDDDNKKDANQFS